MSLAAFVDSYLETLPTLPVSTGALGYGSDLDSAIGPDGQLDFFADYRTTDPQSPHAIGVALLRRFVTPRGMLRDPEYGLDLRGMLHVPQLASTLSSLERLVQQECIKDDRVLQAEVSLTLTDSKLRVKLRITPADGSGAFDLVYWVDDGRLING